MTEAERNELKRLAGKATPGPWIHDPNGSRSVMVYSDDRTGSAIAQCELTYVARPPGECEANAAYIAHVHPQAILSLITELESRPRREDVLEEAATVCDDYADHMDKQAAKQAAEGKRALVPVCKEDAAESLAAQIRALKDKPHE